MSRTNNNPVTVELPLKRTPIRPEERAAIRAGLKVHRERRTDRDTGQIYWHERRHTDDLPEIVRYLAERTPVAVIRDLIEAYQGSSSRFDYRQCGHIHVFAIDLTPGKEA